MDLEQFGQSPNGYTPASGEAQDHEDLVAREREVLWPQSRIDLVDQESVGSEKEEDCLYSVGRLAPPPRVPFPVS